MKIQLNTTQCLLLLVAALLALNLVATLSRSGSERTTSAAIDAVMPRAHAAGVLRLEDFLVTTNQEGDVLYVWRPGHIVNDQFRSIEVQRYAHN